MKKRSFSKGNSIYVFLFIGILSLVLLHLYIYTKNITLKYEASNLKIKLKELKSTNKLLSSMLSAEESLDKIEQTAATKLNMHYPETISYIILSKEAKQ